MADKLTFTPAVRLERQPFAPEPGAPGESRAGAGRKVLVIDDCVVVLKALEMKLAGNGFKVFTANEASQALGAVREESPDVIVLDLNFTTSTTFSPFSWGGLQILRWLKRCEDLAGVPIVILSADEPEKSRAQALTEGAAAYFQKPVDGKLFVEELARLTGGKRG